MTRRPETDHPDSRHRGATPSYRIQGLAYQGAMEAVFAIPVGLGLGYLGDRTFGTYPICLLVGGVVGFSAFVVRLVRLGRQLQPGDAEPGDAEAGKPEDTERMKSTGPEQPREEK